MVRSAGRSLEDGRYFVMSLAPGAWDLVAVPPADDLGGFNSDPAEIARLRAEATRVTLAEHQRLRLDLVVVER
jgi:hypothetical protein